MKIDAADWSALADDLDGQTRRVGVNLLRAQETAPDAALEARGLGKRFGVPTSLVEADMDAWRKRAQIEDRRSTVDESPGLRAFVAADPLNAAIIDDTSLRKMGVFERKWRSAVGSLSFSGSAVSGIGGFVDSAQRRVLEGFANTFLPTPRAGGKIDPASLHGPTAGGDFKAVGKPMADYFRAIDVPEDQKDWLDHVVGGVGQVAQQLALVALNPYLGGIALVGSASDQMEQKTAGDTAPQSAKDAALLLGAPITAGTEFLSNKLMLGMDRIPGLRNLDFKNILAARGARVGVAGAAEGVQETSESLLQDFTRQQLTNPKAEIGVGGALYEGSVGTAVGGIMRSLIEGALHVRTRQTRQMFDALNEAGKDNPLREKAPDAYREFVAEATKNGPVDNVFIPAERFTTYFQSAGIEPETAAIEIGATNYAEAASLGTDVVVPLADFAAHVAGTDHYAGLSADLRLHQGDMTAREQAEYDANAEAREAKLRDMLDAMVAEGQKAAGINAAIDRVVSDIEGQLIASGVEPGTATRQAMVFRGGAVLAQRAFPDKDAVQMLEQLWAPYGLQVRRDLPAILTQIKNANLEVDPLLDMLRGSGGPSDKRTFGQSLVPFLRSIGGLLPVGETLDMEKYPGLPGEKRLISNTGLSLDDAAMLAAEAGYFNPDRNGLVSESELIEAIENELAGSPLYSVLQTDEHLMGVQQQLASLSQALKDADIDLNAVTDNAEVRRLLEQTGAVTGAIFGQASNALSPTQAVVQRWRDALGKASRDRLDYAPTFDTPAVLREMGIRARDLALPVRYLLAIRETHPDVPLSVFENLPALLSDPLLVIPYRNGGWRVFVDATTQAQSPIAVGVGADGRIQTVTPIDPSRDMDSVERIQSMIAATEPRAKLYARNREAPVKTEASTVAASGLIPLHRFSTGSRIVVTRAQLVKRHGDTFYQDAATPEPTFRAPEVRDAQGRLLAPNGKPSSLNEQQWHQVRSPEFLEWFGPWLTDPANASQVIDENGEPMVVYHGTSADFNVFNLTRGGNLGPGIYFTPDKDQAEAYARTHKGSRVVDVFLYAKNPLLIDNGNTSPQQLYEAFPAESDAATIAKVREAGHDAVWAVNSVKNKWGATTREIAVFDSTQIKSATGNTGAFGQRPITEAEADRFGMSVEEANAAQERGDIRFQNAGDAKRGYLQIGPDRKMRLGLTEKADLSTFLHETGHFYLEMLGDLAEMDGVSEQIKQDYALILKWFGIGHTVDAGGNVALRPEDVKNGEDLRDMAARFGMTPRALVESWKGKPPRANTEQGDLWGRLDGVPELALYAAEHPAWKPGALRLESQTPMDVWRGMTAEERRSYHEMFARANEAYLMEGKAPAPELRGVFQRFSAWLKSIYKTLAALDVELTDEVRGVFDRIYATDAEIDAAAREMEIAPMPDEALKARMSESEYRIYSEAVANATEAGRDALRARMMREFKRGQEEWWQDERKQVRDEVTAEIDALPVYAAFNALTATGAEKLSRADLEWRYGDDFVKRLPRGFGRIYTREGGMTLDAAAERFGFADGDALIKALMEMRPRRELIEAETDARMIERHGDIRQDGTATEAAFAALNNDARADVLAIELRALGGQAVGQAMRRAAEAAIGRTRHLDIRPHAYLIAGRKAARQALEAALAGDLDAARTAKERELLNHHMHRAASAAREEGAKIEKHMRRLNHDNKLRARIGKAGQEWLAQVDGILARVSFVPHSRTLKSRATAEWAQAVKEATGEEIAVSPLVMDEASRTNWREMTMDELRAVDDTLKSIEHVAKKIQQVMLNGQRYEMEQIVEKVLTAIKASPLTHREPPRGGEEPSLADRIRAVDRTLWRPEKIMEMLDGGKSGIFHDLLWNRASAAQNLANELKAQILAPLTQFVTDMPAAERARMEEKLYINALGHAFSRRELIGMALNMGNDSNLDKLQRGGVVRHLGEEPTLITDAAVAEIKAALSASDWKMITTLWGTIEQLYPHLNDLNIRAVGLPLPKIEAITVETPYGNLPGGYWPAVGDPLHSRVGETQEQANAVSAADFFPQPFVQAATAHSFRETRTRAAYPLLFDWQRIVSRHVSQATTDIAYHELVKETTRILKRSQVKAALVGKLGPDGYQGLLDWLAYQVNATAGGMLGARPMDTLMQTAVAHTAVAALGLKASTALGNIIVAPVQASHQIKGRFMAAGYAEFLRDPKATLTKVRALSGAMRYRHEHLDASYNQVLATLSGQDSLRKTIARWAMEIHAVADVLATTGLWLGRYNQEMAATDGNVDAAILAADKTIRTTQTAGAPKDLSAFERDPRWSWSKMFLGPMLVLQNEARGAFVLRRDRLTTLIAVWLLPAVLFEMAVGRGPDEDEEELEWAIRKMLLYPLQTIPLLRDAASAIEAAMTHKPAMTRANPIAEFAISGVRAWNKLTSDTADAGDKAQAVLQVTGLLTGLPGGAVGQATNYAVDLATGETQMESPTDVRYFFIRRSADRHD